ncbi:MAG: 50S ribosomal protein L18 [Planctomycetes bacterium]|nr:50S ribosomal protein L18 [Planctomycetota bacterium]
MERTKQKLVRRERRKKRVRRRVYGTAEKPRLSVFRSLKHIYAQLIDDDKGQTLVAASTRSAELKEGGGGNKAAAAKVGRLLGEKAAARGINEVAFDRNGYRFHGRVKALADAAREAGLKV